MSTVVGIKHVTFIYAIFNFQQDVMSMHWIRIAVIRENECHVAKAPLMKCAEINFALGPNY